MCGGAGVDKFTDECIQVWVSFLWKRVPTFCDWACVWENIGLH